MVFFSFSFFHRHLFLTYTAISAVGIRAKEHIKDKLRCRPNDAVASARPRECAAIFP